MKKHFLTLTAVCCFFAAVSVSSGQTALLSFNDGNGTPNAGTIDVGVGQTTFTLALNLAFAPAGSVVNLEGLSYWFVQTSPAGPQPISITNRDATGSLFTDLQTPGISYPQ